MKTISAMAGLLALFVAFGCGGNGDSNGDVQTDNQMAEVPSDIVYTPTSEPVTVAGVTFYPDSAWIDAGPSGMRQAEFYLPPQEGQKDSASVAVYYFGPNQGGSIEANLDRWVSQVRPDDGIEPVRSEMEANGMTVHIVETEGTYTGDMGPMAQNGGQAQENYRLIGAVVEGPQGNVFFKLTGPSWTAAHMAPQFKGMLRNLEQASM